MNTHIPLLEEVVTGVTTPCSSQPIPPGAKWGDVMEDEEEHLRQETAECEAAVAHDLRQFPPTSVGFPALLVLAVQLPQIFACLQISSWCS